MAGRKESAPMSEMRDEIVRTQEQLWQKCRVLEEEVRSVVEHTRDRVLDGVHSTYEVVSPAQHLRRHPLVSCLVVASAAYLIGRRRGRRGLRGTAHGVDHDNVLQVLPPKPPSLFAQLLSHGVGILGEIVRSRLVGGSRKD